jgi:hypothetical protein
LSGFGLNSPLVPSLALTPTLISPTDCGAITTNSLIADTDSLSLPEWAELRTTRLPSTVLRTVASATPVWLPHNLRPIISAAHGIYVIEARTLEAETKGEQTIV